MAQQNEWLSWAEDRADLVRNNGVCRRFPRQIFDRSFSFTKYISNYSITFDQCSPITLSLNGIYFKDT